MMAAEQNHSNFERGTNVSDPKKYATATLVFRETDVDVSLTGMDFVNPQTLYRAGKKLNQLFMRERAKLIMANNERERAKEKGEYITPPVVTETVVEPLKTGLEATTEKGGPSQVTGADAPKIEEKPVVTVEKKTYVKK